jgi:hypothetical protein
VRTAERHAKRSGELRVVDVHARTRRREAVVSGEVHALSRPSNPARVSSDITFSGDERRQLPAVLGADRTVGTWRDPLHEAVVQAGTANLGLSM